MCSPLAITVGLQQGRCIIGKPKSPTPPDPVKTAGAQTGTNIGTAIANTTMGNVNQVGPNGSLTYSQNGTRPWTDPSSGQTYQIPQYTATTALSPAQQAIYNQQNQNTQGMGQLAGQQIDRLGQTLGQNFNPSNLPAAGTVPGQSQFQNLPTTAGQGVTQSYGANDFGAQRDQVQQALMDRLQPGLDRDKQAMDAQLANQGIGMGSRAYSASQQDYGRNVNDARLGAVLGAGQEQSRLVGMDRDRAMFQNAAQGQQFGQLFQGTQANNQNQSQTFNQGLQAFGAQNDLRGQSMQEQMAMRNQPINEISALLSGGQVSMPNFQANRPAQAATTDVAGLINANYGQQMGNYQNQMGLYQSGLGGLFGLGAAAIGASDRRLKRDIRKVDQRGNLNVYAYRYAWDRPDMVRRGYMAQEVEAVRPDAVVRRDDWLGLDYSKLPAVA